MKRKFFLHRQNEPMTPDTVVYRVWVGESVREQRILTQLMSWAFAQSATLRSWSEDIDYYLDLESERCFPGRGLLDFGFISVDLTAAEALSLANTSQWDSYEKTLSQPKSFFSAICLNSPARVKSDSGKILPSSCQADRRKNLSERWEGNRFIISFI